MATAPIYREDMREGSSPLPLRSLAAVLAIIAGGLRRDLANGAESADDVLLQGAPPELPGAIAAIALWSEALTVQLDRARDCLGVDSDARANPAPPQVPAARVVVQHTCQALAHLTHVLRRWAESAEADADALDKAARMVARGAARAYDDDGVIVVLPAAATRGAEA